MVIFFYQNVKLYNRIERHLPSISIHILSSLTISNEYTFYKKKLSFGHQRRLVLAFLFGYFRSDFSGKRILVPSHSFFLHRLWECFTTKIFKADDFLDNPPDSCLCLTRHLINCTRVLTLHIVSYFFWMIHCRYKTFSICNLGWTCLTLLLCRAIHNKRRIRQGY